MNASKYRTLLETLKKDILGGKYGSGQSFPSLRALVRRYGLSKNMVQHAIDELTHQGLIARTQGRGTFVTRQGAQRKLGVIVPRHAYSEIFPRIIGEFSRLAQKSGYTLLFGDITAAKPEQRAKMAKKLAKEFVAEGVAGVMFQPIEYLSDAERLNGEVLGIFDKAGVAVVLCDYDIVPAPRRSKYDLVGINNVEAGAAMADYLLRAGAKKITALLRPNAPLSHQNRARGAQIAAKLGADKAPKIRVLEAEPDNLSAIRRHLKTFRPNAFLCGNDAIAAHLRQTLEKLKVRVPEDVMLAGFDDVSIAPLMLPPLTTMHLPCEGIAEAVFNRLLNRIANPQLPPAELHLDATLVERDSVRACCEKRKLQVGRKKTS